MLAAALLGSGTAWMASYGVGGVVAGRWRGACDKSLYAMEDKLEKSNRGSQMDHGLKGKTVCIADPDHAGLPLAPTLSERPGAGSFGVDAGARSRIEAVNRDALPTPALMTV